MSTPTPAVIPPPPATTPAEDEVFSIEGLSWEQYVTINDALGDRGGLKVRYWNERLTFVSPARVHEWSGDSVDSIIKAVAVGCGIEIDVVASTTLRRASEKAGLEGDKVYYLRDNAVRMAGPVEIDLTQDPPPDFAVEVENSRKASDAMAIYARLGVPELWRLDVRRHILKFRALQFDGTYGEIAQSLGFPFLAPADVLAQLRRAEEARSTIRWLGQLANWVREVIRPRLVPA